MERSFKELLEQKTAETEAAVYAYLPEEKGFQKTIFEAMNYSVKAGGKRLRPLLMMETYRMLGGKGKRSALYGGHRDDPYLISDPRRPALHG